MKAQNIFLDENTGGKGRYFKSRFLQPGLVKYSFGVCVLDKATIDKFIQGFVGCPVIIGHKDVTNASAKEDRVGVISRIWYDNADGWFWGEGIIFDEKAISLVESGYNVSCQYDITEYSNNTTKALHNGNPYDKVILNGKPEHLAIVENPRYENAMIAVNALDMTAENEEHWITIGAGEDTKGRHILVKDGETNKEATERKIKEWKEKGGSSDKKDSKVKRDEKKIADYKKQIHEKYKSLSPEDRQGYLQHLDSEVKEWKDDVNYKEAVEWLKQVDDADIFGKEIKADKSDSKEDKKQAAIDRRHKFQEAGKKRDKVHADFEKGIGTFEDVDKAEKEYQKAYKEFYNYSDEIKDSSDSGKQGSGNIKQSRDEHGRIVISKDGLKNKVKISKNGNYFLASYGQELKDDDGYTEFQLYPGASGKSFKTEAGAIRWANKMLAENTIEPNVIIQAINEIKENGMFKKLFNKKEKFTMEKDEMKALFIDCIQDVLKAQNEEDVEDVEFEEEEEKAENKKCKNKKCKNEDVDKRKLIDEVAGIMKSAGCDDEVIRTAIAKMEKIGYDKSEADTADNAKKAKCEDEEDLEDAKNKAKNSIDELKGLLASAGVSKPSSKYITKAQAIDLGNQLF